MMRARVLQVGTFMINRRAALAIFSKTMVAGAGWMIAGPAHSSRFHFIVTSTPVTQAQASSTYETLVQADMAMLSKRVYSEEGIPMILACEDLTATSPVRPASRTMNDVVAPAFQHVVEAWQHLRPNAPVGDVAKLLELLAYRDFASGGEDIDL